MDLLILDELGYVPASKVGSELLFDVISTAYERNSLVVTTNLPFENWSEVLGSERLTGATLDRLTHRCHILEAGGESYSLRDVKTRRTKSSSSGGHEPKQPTTPSEARPETPHSRASTNQNIATFFARPAPRFLTAVDNFGIRTATSAFNSPY